ncbi:hypothetical protein P2P98_08810 [Microbacterium sp. Kw_RZR3]|uniref:hypothetical protein n=1 Tax=Microbacterium sp. Kw_RZR3 TaxID=3032903 RepID=UPI0023DB663C|nr:hypothetical protein [Microbacterium sp. Kw_RZR3]MDF2046258.1 hypothetical protein [Microbacterium sp. Kw_RZR3]
MKKILAPLTLGTAILMISGCAPTPPTYDQVRAETHDVLRQVADLVPDPKTVEPNEEFEPYPCDDQLTLGGGKGSFYTGQWLVFVEDTFDVPALIDRVPEELGEGWRIDKLGVPVNHPLVYLVRDSPRMSLTVEESTLDGRKAVELLAISRCGTLSEDQRP